MLDAGDEACVMEVSSHALELHRADAIEFDCARVHEPDAGPPRLPRHARRVLRVQAPAVHARPRRADRRRGRERRRRVGRDLAARGARRGGAHAAGHVRRGLDAADYRATSVALRLAPARRSSVTARDGSGRGVGCRCPACSTSTTRWPRSPPRRALGVPLARRRRGACERRRACRAASSRSTRASASACWSTTRTRPTRSRTCCRRRASCSLRKAAAG